MTGSFLHYEDFGAAGDGFRNDLAAIVRCHEEANRLRIPVRAKDGAVYYLGGGAGTARIMTDVDFGTARFIIDDREPEDLTADVFEVVPETEPYSPAIASLMRGDERVDFPHEGRVYLRVWSDEKKIFIRKGLNRNGGVDPSDCLLVDGDGRILTKIDWDHPHVVKTLAKSAEDPPITVRGGVFETIANRHESVYRYHSRGIRITRSNVTVRDLTHLVRGEGDHGAPYGGFLSIDEAADVTVRNVLLTPHFTYWTESQIPGEKVPMGSYEINCTATIASRFYDVHQTIDIMDSRYWGLMGSNYCKEMLFEDCVMSRFDAHMGVTDATIRRSVLGHMCLNLIGHGDFLVEDTDAFGAAVINLRGDYGSSFEGTVTIRRVIWRPKGTALSVIAADNTGDHDFGYPCFMPERVTIEGLTVKDREIVCDKELTILPDYDAGFRPGKPFAYRTTKTLAVSDVTCESGRKWKTAERPEEYPDLRVETDGSRRRKSGDL
ncbi:MAG: hypothetical protein J5849_05320 [Clostridia bacterium]|nr:hypothetical protein [Clostridia bacterium]